MQRRSSTDLMHNGLTLDELRDIVDVLTESHGGSWCVERCGKCCKASLTIPRVEGERLRQVPVVNDTKPSMCPLLNPDQSCSVYADRPVECRVYNVFDEELYRDCVEAGVSDLLDWPEDGNARLAIRALLYTALGRMNGADTTNQSIADWVTE